MMKNIYCYTDTFKTISLETDFDESLENKISDTKHVNNRKIEI